MAKELGKFVLVSCSEKKREQQALDKEIRGCPGYSFVEREDKGNNDIWRGKMNDLKMNPHKRKEDINEIFNSYNKFKSEKAGDYSVKYLRHLSDLLYKTKQIDYVTERKILVKSTTTLNKTKNQKSNSPSNTKIKRPIYTPRNQKEGCKPKANLRKSLFALKTGYPNNKAHSRYCLSSNRVNSLCKLNENEDEVMLREPEIRSEKDDYNYVKLLYSEIKNKWKSFFLINTPHQNNSSNINHSKSFGLRPDNIDKLLQFSSNRYPAKDHFFKILKLRKATSRSPMSTAYSSFPHFSKTCLTTPHC